MSLSLSIVYSQKTVDSPSFRQIKGIQNLNRRIRPRAKMHPLRLTRRDKKSRSIIARRCIAPIALGIPAAAIQKIGRNQRVSRGGTYSAGTSSSPSDPIRKLAKRAPGASNWASSNSRRSR